MGEKSGFFVGIANHERQGYPGNDRVRTAELVRKILRPGFAALLPVLNGPNHY
jgi:hypothetical protein